MNKMFSSKTSDSKGMRDPAVSWGNCKELVVIVFILALTSKQGILKYHCSQRSSQREGVGVESEIQEHNQSDN